MQPGQTLHHREAETGPVIAAIVGIIGLHEWVAELGQIRFGDADAVIGDAEFDSSRRRGAPRRAPSRPDR